MVIGRHLFDIMNGWDGQPPVGDHVVVVSHRPKPDGWHPEASYHFVDDVAEAVSLATTLAEGRSVTVAAGDVGAQALTLGLVDEAAMDVVPVVFGSGKPYFGAVNAHHMLDNPHVVVQGTECSTSDTGSASDIGRQPSSRHQLTIFVGVIRISGVGCLPLRGSTASRASAGPRTCTQRGCQGGRTSSTTKAAWGFAAMLRNLRVRARSRPPTSIVSSSGL